MAQKKINYISRNFADVRNELINFVKQFYPQLYQDFNDASIGSMLIDLNAAVADMLSYNTDRVFNETQIDYAQERRSLLSMARTLGLKIPNKSASVTLVDFTVTVPVRGDTFDIRYAPTIRIGSQVTGGGQIFEILDDVDFSSPFSAGGTPNRLIIPNVDANNNLVSYTLVKREIVIAGTTKIYKRNITVEDNIPFLEITLPDTNVLSIEQVINMEGSVSVTPTIDQFLDDDIRWYEVDSLAEDKIFNKDNNRVSDNSGVSPGKWVSTTKRFVKEYTDLGYCKMTFGSGNSDQDMFNQYANNSFILRIGDFINSTALGEIIKPNTTLFIRYRTGGGVGGNIGSNTINSVGSVQMVINGPNGTINQSVRKSLTVSNPFPAFGGGEAPSTEMLRNMIKYNFASQNRAVTIKDYVAQIFKMPGKYGSPFRMGVSENKNKIEIYTLGLDSNGKLSNQSTNTLKENIATWLADYRMINDYVTVRDGRVVNIAFDVDVLVDKSFNKGEIVNNIITTVKNYLQINKWDMGDEIYLSNLIEEINNVNGVLNITDIRVYNKVGDGVYSLNSTTQPLLDTETGQIDLGEDYKLNTEFDMMYEIRFPEKDIRVRVKS